MKLKIKVTKEILKKSMFCRDDSLIVMNCAIAVAVREIWPKASVTQKYIRIDSSKKTFIEDLPESVGLFIYEFDRSTPSQRLEIPEFEFEVEIDPDIHLSHFDISELKEILTNSSTLELV